jgi:hypothetical protein
MLPQDEGDNILYYCEIKRKMIHTQASDGHSLQIPKHTQFYYFKKTNTLGLDET